MFKHSCNDNTIKRAITSHLQSLNMHVKDHAIRRWKSRTWLWNWHNSMVVLNQLMLMKRS